MLDYGSIIGVRLKLWSSVVHFYSYVLVFLYLGICNMESHIFV